MALLLLVGGVASRVDPNIPGVKKYFCRSLNLHSPGKGVQPQTQHRDYTRTYSHTFPFLFVDRFVEAHRALAEEREMNHNRSIPHTCTHKAFSFRFRQVVETDRALAEERETSQAARAEAVSLRSELSSVQSELSQVSNQLVSERSAGEPLVFSKSFAWLSPI